MAHRSFVLTGLATADGRSQPQRHGNADIDAVIVNLWWVAGL
ncbi:MAG: hypothetical protein O2890_09775 [Cyanobacteria bacterium]|nr:hypothetical protein [Cyanobacteriota bacterium]MDA0866692.1 hypothetical protein [Cyanobacteriota bacterium]